MSKDNSHNCISSSDLLKQTKLNIEKFGLQVIMVSATNYCPSFAYSVGLTETYNHPEIICFGLPSNLGHEIINDVAKIIERGEVIECGEKYEELFEKSSAKFINVDKRNIEDYFGVAIRYYENREFHAIQLIWTDKNDRFPWDEFFQEEYLHIQPLLDRNANFKFYESKKLTVFTTRQWLENQKPILRVVHDDEGDWQFLTGDQLSEDIRIVSLEEIVKKDTTLNQIFDLEYGESADRNFIGGKWTRNKISE